MAKVDYIIKLVAAIMVIHLVMVHVEATSTHNNGNYGGNKISGACITTCVAICIVSEELFPVCMAACLLNCNDPNSNTPAVRNCTSGCAQSTCSKFISDGIAFGQCVVNECIGKCLPGNDMN